MQPVVQATTRTPGPSTVEPVVNECRKPMSPLSSALWTSVSGTSFARFTRSSNGLFASRAAGFWARALAIAVSVERAIDDVHLLLLREPHEVHGVTRHANREARVFFGMLHRVHERLAVQHVDVHVEARRSEERVEHRREVRHAV